MNIFSNRLLLRPVISIALVVLLLVVTSSVIFYVQRTLSEIEEALPITLSKQERDIRVLVYDMGILVQSIGFARSTRGTAGFSKVLRQADGVEEYLENTALTTCWACPRYTPRSILPFSISRPGLRKVSLISNQPRLKL
jgi:hypothetical protein